MQTPRRLLQWRRQRFGLRKPKLVISTSVPSGPKGFRVSSFLSPWAYARRCLTYASVMGTGSSGGIYKVALRSGETLAVKKMWSSEDTGAFRNEITALGSIRHRNITRLLGWGANLTTRPLFYSYHPNGSLCSFLCGGRKGSAEWETRYDIVLGLAHAVAYLHHDCVPPILHGIVKDMNVLLGPSLEPYLADLGLARPMTTSNDKKDPGASSRVPRSYRYMGPEYGSAQCITEKRDVYSYSVVLLEVLTRKHPLDLALPRGGTWCSGFSTTGTARKTHPTSSTHGHVAGQSHKCKRWSRRWPSSFSASAARQATAPP